MIHGKIDLTDTIYLALLSGKLNDDECRILQRFMNLRAPQHQIIIVPVIEIVEDDTKLGRPNPAKGENNGTVE